MTYILVAIALYSFAVLMALILCMAAGRGNDLLEVEKEQKKAAISAYERHQDVA